MRLVFHPKVYSDIAQVMEYYEQVANADLADEFYAELRRLMQEQQRDLSLFRSANATFAEPTCGVFRIIFCFG
jgi:hypothetical protein